MATIYSPWLRISLLLADSNNRGLYLLFSFFIELPHWYELNIVSVTFAFVKSVTVFSYSFVKNCVFLRRTQRTAKLAIGPHEGLQLLMIYNKLTIKQKSFGQFARAGVQLNVGFQGNYYKADAF